MIHRRLFQALRTEYPLLAVGAASTILTSLMAILQAVLLGTIINGVFIEHGNLQRERPEMIALFLCIVLRVILTFAGESLMALTAIRFKSRLREQLFSHLIGLGPAWLREERSGELAGTLYEGTEQLEPYITRYVPATLVSVFIPVTILALVFTHDRVAALLLFVTMPMIPFFMILVGKMSESLTKRQWALLSLLGAHFFDVLKGLITLKLFFRSKAQIQTIREISDAYRKTTMRTLRVAFLSGFVLDLIATLSTALVAVTVGLRLLHGQETFLNGFIVLLLTPEFYLPFRNLGAEYHASMNGVEAAERIFQILDRKPAGIVSGKVSTGVAEEQNREAGNSILLEDVSFSYSGAKTERQALTSISLKIDAGESIAIVGPSGAGKSTLLDIVVGFLQPTSGKIIVGSSVELSSDSVSWWRAQVAYVPQRPYLFCGTILENLQFANPNCSEADVRKAAKKTGVDKFVHTFPMGYETMLLENGVSLSGGQMQRIALCRAFLKDSPVFILDEPTAHLDVESEFYIRQALAELAHARTGIIVAHRLGTIAHVNRVAVMDQGGIVCVGKHMDLSRTNSVYQKLVQASFGEDVS